MGEKAVVGALDDVGDGMQCVDHPYRSNPGGVCAFCLQEKLGRLVSSSKTTPFLSLQRPPSSSSSPTSFRSDVVGGGGAVGHVSACSHDAAATGRVTKFPFLAAGHSKNKKSGGGGNGGKKLVASGGTTRSTASVAVAEDGSGLVLNRSKSVAPRTTGCSFAQVGVGGGRSNGEAAAVTDSPRKKSFWSFLYHSSVSSTPTSSSSAANANVNRRRSTSFSSGGVCDGDTTKQPQQQPPPANILDKLEGATAAPAQSVEGGGGVESPSGSQASSSFGRKVARSRSVGCGSRSFSGDFLERISTGFGDCTLRRVESQRQAKPKSSLLIDNDGDQHRSRMKERVKCGGLFGGFGITSAYWLSAAAAAPDQDFDGDIKVSATAPTSRAGVTPHGRTKSWGLAFTSPIRAFRPHSSSSRPASATNFISSINATNKLVNGNSNGGKGSCRLDGNASSLSVQT